MRSSRTRSRYIPTLTAAGGGNTYTKAGFAVCGGLIGSGPADSVYAETGFGATGLVGSGPSASIFQETGSARWSGGLPAGRALLPRLEGSRPGVYRDFLKRLLKQAGGRSST